MNKLERFIFLIALFLACRDLSAIEWDTASDVAVCYKRVGYEKNEERVVAALKEKGINSVIMYYIRDRGVVSPALKENAKVEGFLILVDKRDATLAKGVLKHEVETGLKITLLKKSILEPDGK